MKINQKANAILELISIYLNQKKLSGVFIRFLNCLIIKFKCEILRVTLQTNIIACVTGLKKGINNESNFWHFQNINFKHIVFKTFKTDYAANIATFLTLWSTAIIGKG